MSHDATDPAGVGRRVTASEEGAAIQQARQLVGLEFEYDESVVELAAALHVTRAPTCGWRGPGRVNEEQNELSDAALRSSVKDGKVERTYRFRLHPKAPLSCSHKPLCSGPRGNPNRYPNSRPRTRRRVARRSPNRSPPPSALSRRSCRWSAITRCPRVRASCASSPRRKD